MPEYSLDDFERKLKEMGLEASPYSATQETPIMAPGGMEFSNASGGPTFMPGVTPPEQVGTEYSEDINLQPVQQEKLYSELFGQTQPEQAPLAETPAATPEKTPNQITRAEAKQMQAAAPAPAPAPVEDPTKATTGQDVSQYIREKYGIKKELGDEAIKEAQGKARVGELIANVGESMDAMTATIAGTNPRQAFYQRLREQAQRPVEEIAQRRAASKEEDEAVAKGVATETSFENLAKGKRAIDPNSPESKRARFLLKQLTPELAKDPNFETLTAAETDDAIKVLGLKENIEMRKEVAASRREEKARATEEKAKDTSRKEAIADKARLDKELNIRNIRSNTPIGRSATLENNIREAQALLQQMAVAPKDQVPQLVAGFSQAMGRVEAASASSGAVARGTAHEQAINTLSNDIAQARQYITGDPKGSNITKFLPIFDRTLYRASKVNEDIVGEYLDSVKKRKDKDPYAKYSPEEFESIIEDEREAHRAIEPYFPENKVGGTPAKTAEEGWTSEKQKRLDELRARRAAQRGQ